MSNTAYLGLGHRQPPRVACVCGERIPAGNKNHPRACHAALDRDGYPLSNELRAELAAAGHDVPAVELALGRHALGRDSQLTLQRQYGPAAFRRLVWDTARSL